MRIITDRQHTAEWFTARLGLPTASRFGDIMPGAKGKYKEARRKYAIELCYERLTGVPAQHFSNDAMQWGTDNEAAARDAYAAHKLSSIAQVGLVKHDTLEVGCSPDGLIGDDGLTQIKCPYNSVIHLGYIVDGVVPSEYEHQVYGELFVTGREWCDFVSFDRRMPEEQQLFICSAILTKERADVIETELKAFCQYVDEMMGAIKNGHKPVGDCC